jgi:hypothetical protein
MMRLMGSRLFLVALLLAAPAGAFADVYKWTDERGVIVLSSVPPEDTTFARNVEVVAKEKGSTRKTAGAVEYRNASNEEVLLDRIENLERQLRAQQYSQAAPPPAVQYPQGYYTTPTLPASSYGETYYPPSYPGYTSPGYYSYPYAAFFPPVTSVIIRPRPHFNHKHFHHRHSSHDFSHGTFPRTFGHSGFARPTGTFRGRR